MAVKFISHVEPNKLGGWFIRLIDTLEETEVICNDLDEYAKNIEELGSEYGGDIEVEWKKDKALTPASILDLQEKMAIMQEKYQEEIDIINNQKDNHEVNLKNQ
jgi:hypothetical protein